MRLGRVHASRDVPCGRDDDGDDAVRLDEEIGLSVLAGVGMR
jgi:hypothetical protein